MKTKIMSIPLTRNGSIKLSFTQSGNNWICSVDDETIQDIDLFFQSGYYVLDREKPITIENQ